MILRPPPCVVCKSRAHKMVKLPTGWHCVYCAHGLAPTPRKPKVPQRETLDDAMVE